ncbi:DNA damage-binding protein 2 [Plakobranchus ocellatus]|uniref:DNA damage-binding protein 2 n=1 Tax=Plakobranchus ocellatus TaxID=259542 RepID=A0AAV3ZNU7_9GAST|nr:DNA damage-binding protein 2 [Plakobranchus ocellatus]
MASINYQGRVTRSARNISVNSASDKGTSVSSSTSRSSRKTNQPLIKTDNDASNLKTGLIQKGKTNEDLETTLKSKPCSYLKGSKKSTLRSKSSICSSRKSLSVPEDDSDCKSNSARVPTSFDGEKEPNNCQTTHQSEQILSSRPVTKKKKRIDSGDSCSSELHEISYSFDSGIETGSIRSNTPSAVQTPSPSLRHEKEFSIDFPCEGSQDPVCALVWPTSGIKSKNVFHYVWNMSTGRLSPSNKKALADQQILSHVADFEVFTHDKPFGSRITTIDWHPRKHNFFCATSKHGDLGFYQSDCDQRVKLEPLKTYSGIGPGGYISAFKFHPSDNERFYTSTLEGKVVLGNLERGGDHVERVLLSTGTWDFWYCAMDVSSMGDFVVSSRNNGMTVMCTPSGELIWQLRLHSKKVTHIELSPREPYLLCTASLDHTVRLWDIRMLKQIKGKFKPLEELPHEKGVNSAYFSLTDGARLLTTDQHDEIRVYRAPYWHLETTILHPHRFFRHMTPHKAAWHPLVDKIVCGRYPGDSSHPEYGLERSIDIFDAASGEMHCELKDPQFNGLVSLCKFNNTGEQLLSSMGYQINIWRKDFEDSSEEGIAKPPFNQGGTPRAHNRNNSSRQSNKRRKETDNKVTKVKLSKMQKKVA